MHMLNGAPLGSVGTANQSGWMLESTFDVFMGHFISSVRHQRITLFFSYWIIIRPTCLFPQNFVHLLSFPAHCSHKLQPLDVSVHGPFKKYNTAAQATWMRNNPGRTMTIYDIPGIVGISFPLAFTPSNITAGFRKSGISPFDREGFHAIADYAPGFVTDRVEPAEFLLYILCVNIPFNLPLDDAEFGELDFYGRPDYSFKNYL